MHCQFSNIVNFSTLSSSIHGHLFRLETFQCCPLSCTVKASTSLHSHISFTVKIHTMSSFHTVNTFLHCHLAHTDIFPTLLSLHLCQFSFIVNFCSTLFDSKTAIFFFAYAVRCSGASLRFVISLEVITRTLAAAPEKDELVIL
jgi:hypothetical protein